MIPRTLLPTGHEQTGDRQTLAIQATANRAARAANARGGLPVTTPSTTFTAGSSQAIAHRLGRIPLGWRAVDVTGSYGLFFRVSWDANYITIQSGNGCTAAFEVW